MKRLLKITARDESGAVTVDWVVLTAAVVGLAGAAILSIAGGAESVGTAVETVLSNIESGSE
jgi:Flp pilus assembly pilin Flp